MDHANAICEPRLSSARWVCAECAVSCVSVFVPVAEICVYCSFHLYQLLDRVHPYVHAIPLFLTNSVLVVRANIIADDGEYVANSPIINGAACHTMHHLYFNYNYGQFTTLSDRLFGSYRKPNDELFSRESKMSKAEWERQSKEMEKVVKEVEGDDDRAYGDEAKRIQKKMM